MKIDRWMKITGMLWLAFSLWRPTNSFASVGPPPLTDIQIGAWNFDDAGWLTMVGDSPISFTNLDNPADWDGHALQVDSPYPAWLQYNIVEEDNTTNLAFFPQGTIEFWFMPDWNSGEGPGDAGRLIEIGAYGTNSPSSWWSLYFNPGGTNLYFSSETNGVFTNYLTVPISWASNNWHLIDLAYSSSQSQLYIDGQLVTNGAGSLYQPSPTAFTNGFFVGSDVTGTQQMRGQMDNLATFNYAVNADMVAFDYEQVTNGDSGGGGRAEPQYGTNLWLAFTSMVSNTIPLVISNTPSDCLLEIQGCTNLAQGIWFSEGFVDGSELTNWTAANIPVRQPGNLFLRIRSWQDTTGTGIPDWWWLANFNQITNVDAYAEDPANDGLTDLQKYQMGLDPDDYYSTNPPAGFFGYLNPGGTNAFIAWSPSPGPVANYAIQRGIQQANGSYVYTQIGLVSSNATYFEDTGAITNANAQNNVYHLEAVYPNNVYSPTDSWEVWLFTDYGSYGPPYGPPFPNNFFASVDSTGTNVSLSWTAPIGGTPTNYIILRGIFDATNYDYNYTQIASVSTNTNAFKVAGSVTNGNNWSDSYGIEAVYPGGGLSQPATSYLNVGSPNGPAAPPSFFGYPDSTETNIILTWSPASGDVSKYIIYGANYDDETYVYTNVTIGEVSGTTTSFEVVGGTDGSGDYLYDSFSVVAVYANGSESQAASWSIYDSTPAPGILYAYLNSTGTNVQLVWSPATGAITGYLIQRSDLDNSFYQIDEVASNTTSYVDVDEFDNAPYGIDAVSYQVQAMYASNGLSPAVTAMVSNTPPVPTGLAATVDSTGTNVLLTWNPALGGVTNYNILILRGTYNPATGSYSYSQIAEVGGNATSFEDAGVISGNNENYVYELEAANAGGGSSSPIFAPLTPSQAAPSNISVTAKVVRNETGRWEVMFSAIPTNVTTVQLYIAPFGYDGLEEPVNLQDYNGYSSLFYNYSEDLVDTIPVSSLTNGYFVIPDSIATNEIGDNRAGRAVGVQPIATGNRVGNIAYAGLLSYDAPCFTDGREHLKQNLLFQLRAATTSQPIGLSVNGIWFYGDYIDVPIPANTNSVESSIFHYSLMINDGGEIPSYVEMDDLWPFTVNYDFVSYLYNTNYTGPSSFVWQTNLVTVPAPPVLGVADPYWIYQVGALGPYSEVGAYTSDGSLYLQSGVDNLFGLPFETALVNDSPGRIATVAPGDSIGQSDVNCFFSQTADPDMESAGYYFTPVNTPGSALPGNTSPIQTYPLPTLPGFASTNQTGLMIASVGDPTVIGGWNKYAVEGTSTYAYLGQYYLTNAFVITNGIITTNTTGVVSPYGNFFPTQAGQVAMVTMPDIDSPYEQGTGVVDVISLNVDANHDGTMDLTYGGPDYVSASNPFRFWVNDVNDAGDDVGDGIPGGNGQPPDGVVFSDGENGPVYSIQGSRNLVNFFPVYLNIGSLFQSNALSAGISATDTNYQFVLSQADGALRFAYTDLTPTNYMNFLRDTNEVFDYLHDTSLTTVSNLNSGGVPVAGYFLSQIAGNNGGVILVEAWTNTTQPLVLTIFHGTNQIAQTSLALSISSVTNMFRSKTMLLHPESGTNADRLTDASVPNEPDTTDMNFIFVHGYNVNPQQAVGWDADFYKRMYWSGSHAKFYAVTWEASDSQILDGNVTIDLQTNIINAFTTAPLLNTFLNSLPGTNVVAAHSLGNMLVLSTLNDCSNQAINTYFMIDAAVAVEALQGNAVPDVNMYHMDWIPYADKLNANHWWQLWPTNDARSTLTWNNRFANLQDASVYNFYSSGEEVLREYSNTNGDPPDELLGALSEVKYFLLTSMENEGLPTGDYTWAWQELLKGRGEYDWLISSTHGGWKFNYNPPYLYVTNGLPAFTPPPGSTIPNSQLQTNAFFDVTSTNFGTADLALFGSGGSTYAQANRNRIIAESIPCLTLPVGANPVDRLAPDGEPDRNFNMSTNTFENGWPAVRLQNATERNNWHHSDCRQVAYTFTYQLFDDMVTFGGLK